MAFNPTVVFDFDGVIHSYKTGWLGEAVIPDPPVPGIKETIAKLREYGYEVVVVSTRCSSKAGMKAIQAWLRQNDIIVDDVLAHKPPAMCYVDDRAICFDGSTSSLFDKIVNFKSWIEKPPSKF